MSEQERLIEAANRVNRRSPARCGSRPGHDGGADPILGVPSRRAVVAVRNRCAHARDRRGNPATRQ